MTFIIWREACIAAVRVFIFKVLLVLTILMLTSWWGTAYLQILLWQIVLLLLVIADSREACLIHWVYHVGQVSIPVVCIWWKIAWWKLARFKITLFLHVIIWNHATFKRTANKTFNRPCIQLLLIQCCMLISWDTGLIWLIWRLLCVTLSLFQGVLIILLEAWSLYIIACVIVWSLVFLIASIKVFLLQINKIFRSH